MTDQNGSNESLLEIISECKQLIEQFDQQLEELSLLFMGKSNVYTDERYIREQRPQSPQHQNGELTDGNPDDPG